MSFGRAQQIIDLNDIQNWQQAVVSGRRGRCGGGW